MSKGRGAGESRAAEGRRGADGAGEQWQDAGKPQGSKCPQFSISSLDPEGAPGRLRARQFCAHTCILGRRSGKIWGEGGHRKPKGGRPRVENCSQRAGGTDDK